MQHHLRVFVEDYISSVVAFIDPGILWKVVMVIVVDNGSI